jgi:hypothetical protein
MKKQLPKRFDEEDIKRWQQVADKETRGNLSLWMDIAEKDNKRSFSAMLNILLCEAIAARKKAKSVRKKQGGSNNA